ncbi:hypothetical protein C8R42DRAFT_723311 [Lentinula raphanica]|nr:hypothetical protein C8R42DRAFT_723311 [Lentinula raphanica]
MLHNNEGPMAKKAKLDNDIEAIIAEIQERYSPGKACHEPAHALISCFIHRSTGQYFDVGFRARAILWAGKIPRSECSKATPKVDISRIPFGESWFKSQHALKIAKSTASTVSLMEVPSTPTVPQVAAAAPVPPADQPQSNLVQQLVAAQQLMIAMGHPLQYSHPFPMSASGSASTLLMSQAHGNHSPSLSTLPKSPTKSPS